MKHEGWLEEALPRHRDRVEAVRLGRLGQRGVVGRQHRHRPGRLAAPCRAASRSRHRVPGAVDPRRHRRGRGARRQRDDIDVGIEDLDGQEDRHAVRLDRRTTACWPRSRTPGVDADDVDIIDAEPDDIYAAWSRGDIDGAYVWNPNLRQAHRRRRQGAGHQRRAGRAGQDHLRPRRRHQRVRRGVPRRACRPGSSSRTGRSKLIQDDPDAAAAAVAAELNIDADGGRGPARGPDLPRPPPSRPAPTTSAAGWPRTCSPRPSSTRSRARSPRSRPAEDYEAAVDAVASPRPSADVTRSTPRGPARRCRTRVGAPRRPPRLRLRRRAGSRPSARSTSTSTPASSSCVVGPVGLRQDDAAARCSPASCTPTDGRR